MINLDAMHRELTALHQEMAARGMPKTLQLRVDSVRTVLAQVEAARQKQDRNNS